MSVISTLYLVAQHQTLGNDGVCGILRGVQCLLIDCLVKCLQRSGGLICGHFVARIEHL